MFQIVGEGVVFFFLLLRFFVVEGGRELGGEGLWLGGGRPGPKGNVCKGLEQRVGIEPRGGASARVCSVYTLRHRPRFQGLMGLV